MNKILTALIVIIIIAIGSVPFFLTSIANEAISVGSNLISALASLVTLIIALVLYSKYGVEKSLLDKQTDVVFRLISELKKTRFIILWEEENILFLQLDMLKDEYWSDYKDKELLFSFGYAEGLNNIWQIAENIFLPSVIMEKMKPLMVHSIRGVSETETIKYMRVSALGLSKEAKDNSFGILNSKSISLEQFVMHWRDTIEVSKKWLKEHSNISVDLNFERS